MATLTGYSSFNFFTKAKTIYVYDKDTVDDLETTNVVYLFLEDTGDSYNVLYVGKTTQKACKRFANHDHWDEAERIGFTDVGIIPLNEKILAIYEQYLIRELNPPLNVIKYEGE